MRLRDTELTLSGASLKRNEFHRETEELPLAKANRSVKLSLAEVWTWGSPRFPIHSGSLPRSSAADRFQNQDEPHRIGVVGCKAIRRIGEVGVETGIQSCLQRPRSRS